MAEYIDREALIEMIKGKAFNLSLVRSLYTDQSARALYGIAEDVEKIPTADVVEVVRCKDCKWYAPNNDGLWYGCAFDTRNSDDEPKPYDFCSYGERMDGKGDSK